MAEADTLALLVARLDAGVREREAALEAIGAERRRAMEAELAEARSERDAAGRELASVRSALSHVEAGNNRQALRLFEEALGLLAEDEPTADAERSVLLAHVGRLHARMDAPDLAGAAYTEALELDLDNDINSGGEVEEIAIFRYLANVARFGGLPIGPLGARAAISAADYDGQIATGRQFERSGGEMSIVLCGCFTPVLVEEIGNDNGKMDAGETFFIRGRFLERMQSTSWRS